MTKIFLGHNIEEREVSLLSITKKSGSILLLEEEKPFDSVELAMKFYSEKIREILSQDWKVC